MEGVLGLMGRIEKHVGAGELFIGHSVRRRSDFRLLIPWFNLYDAATLNGKDYKFGKESVYALKNMAHRMLGKTTAAHGRKGKVRPKGQSTPLKESASALLN